MDDLKAFRVPVLILSGGEPLLRPDLFEIAARAKAMGFYVGLSTNGTLIDAAMAERVAAQGFDYVGISLDGLRETHDRFRRKQGAFDASLAAVRLLRERGVKVGLRFTMTGHERRRPARAAAADARRRRRQVLLLAPELRRPRQHPPRARTRSSQRRATRWTCCSTTAWARRARRRGARIRHRQQRCRRRLPAAVGAAPPAALGRRTCEPGSRPGAATPRACTWPTSTTSAMCTPTRCGGTTTWAACASGRSRGSGATRVRSADGRPEARSRARSPAAAAPARICDICGGNTRVRAQQVTGDPWAEDPGCYLDDAEIGLPRQRRPIASLEDDAVPRPAARRDHVESDAARGALLAGLLATLGIAAPHRPRPTPRRSTSSTAPPATARSASA